MNSKYLIREVLNLRYLILQPIVFIVILRQFFPVSHNASQVLSTIKLKVSAPYPFTDPIMTPFTKYFWMKG